ncbi:chemotaxis protein CheW [Crocosphaera sp.]|uniref:chemotaxis protein CheW n=1 Tax=Crocosphaera sp. TaxID=2729996 RepID=UPI003F204D39|nr:chemotaxis protein CheW [Crocosphaera sp.]
MKKDYFAIELSNSIHLALSLENMGTVIQIDPEKICLIPGVSSYLLGVTNYQGSLLWVLDTEQFFQLESNLRNCKQSLTAIIIKSSISGTQKKVALVVKKIQGVLNIKTQSKIVPSDSVLSQVQFFLDNIVMANNSTFGILNSDKIFEAIATELK